MRLIDAEALEKAMTKGLKELDPYQSKVFVEFMCYVDDAPTVEMAEDCISRKKVLNIITDWFACGNIADGKSTMRAQIKALPSVKPQPKSEDMGEVSDGYHTFNQLYHQRAILFATIVNQNKDRAWKSYKHEDGKYCFDKDGEWFIVGIDTPLGSYTYHYSKEYWDYFNCEELECGKHWDGHTEKDVTRLLSLPSVTLQSKKGKWIRITNGAMREIYICSECGRQIENDGIEELIAIKYPYCHCGCRMINPQDNEDEDDRKRSLLDYK